MLTQPQLHVAVFAALLPGRAWPASSWGKQGLGGNVGTTPTSPARLHLCLAGPAPAAQLGMTPARAPWRQSECGARTRGGPGPRGRRTWSGSLLCHLPNAPLTPRPLGCMYSHLPLTNKETKEQNKSSFSLAQRLLVRFRELCRTLCNVNGLKSQEERVRPQTRFRRGN